CLLVTDVGLRPGSPVRSGHAMRAGSPLGAVNRLRRAVRASSAFYAGHPRRVLLTGVGLRPRPALRPARALPPGRALRADCTLRANRELLDGVALRSGHAVRASDALCPGRDLLTDVGLRVGDGLRAVRVARVGGDDRPRRTVRPAAALRADSRV